MVNGHPVETDSEGYLRDLGDWSEDFVRALAAQEELTLTEEHWELVHFLRAYYAEHGVQAQVRAMIKHFTRGLGTRSAAATTTCTTSSPVGVRRNRAIGWPACCVPKANTERRLPCSH